jgi:tetratricopeptide (TPR) repeat protein
MLGGNPEESRRNLAEAMAAQPANPDYLFAYAGLQGSELLYSEALATLQKARDLAPGSEAILYQIAVTDALLTRYADAIRTCREGLEHSKIPDEFYFLLGVIALEQHAFADARTALEKAVALNSRVAAYHSALGVALFEDRQFGQSLPEFDKALSLDPKNASAYLWRSRAYAQHSEREKAEADRAAYQALIAPEDKTDSSLASSNGQSATPPGLGPRRGPTKDDPESASFLDQLWITRLREGLGEVSSNH